MRPPATVGFHPSDIPVCKTYKLKDERDAAEAAEEMVRLGFQNRREGFRVLMPKENPKLAKRMGYAVTTGVTHGLRQKKEARDVRYWTYHHDDDVHYAIVLVGSGALRDLGFDGDG